ncbi:hypothetical protein EDB92DRAFT_1872102 [Lactarius akahatsu]|uniref:Uncharacterized protein n=1 Tax=Lactarius akahatsu TaxID=416441 RepID=A0AAD4LEN9_9AGAM|nr:hypothetical protein EDB92DRAFT_1872102 [Lactarius akahatsu]
MAENGSRFSKLVALGALLWDRSIGLAVRCQEGDQEERSDDRSANVDAAPPPLGVKLTGYRLLNITIGRSTEPTTLDWVGGALLAVFQTHFTEVPTASSLYWIGLYEQRDTWEWFFQVDLAPGIGYCAKRVVGGGNHTHVLPAIRCLY